MTSNALLQIFCYLLVLTILAKPIGYYMACIYEGKRCGFNFLLRPVENYIYRLCRVEHQQEMDWKTYALAVLLFNFFGLLLLYFLQRLQVFLPLNPQSFGSVRPDLAFNTAISFTTNTNWQIYAGESVFGYTVRILGLTLQNFVSAATGMSVLIAMIRGFARKETKLLGNFWVDLVRGVFYILFPLALILAMLLVSQGTIQNFRPYQKVQVLQTSVYAKSLVNSHKNKFGNATISVKEQILPMGPVASQVAIKQLGSNGGGYFGANSAHPFENPTPLSNFLEMLALLLIPASFCFTFGTMVRDNKKGLAIFLVMTCIFLPFLFLTVHSELKGNPLLNSTSLQASAGNMEGKETRLGVVNSALWTAAATASSNGAANSALDSYMPMGSFVPMCLMQLGEVIYGGVGSGLYGMLLFVIITVFIAGLMVGRTPEYLGKKIEIFEMKMASLAILIPHFLILLFTAIAVFTDAGRAAIGNPGVHGFSEILYAFTSTTSNNGSIFAGLKADTLFYNVLTGLAMLIGRYWVIIPILAIAGSLARKKTVPISRGTLPTHSPLFIVLTICVILIIGALAFFPVLALGPIVEHLSMLGN